MGRLDYATHLVCCDIIVNIALIGSVSSSLACLEALVESGVEVTGVLGVDEARAAKIFDYRSLRETAQRANVPYQSFVKVTEPGVEAFLRDHRPDQLWVIGLSQLMPQRLIEIAPRGGVGFHPTMLPEGRGRAPVAWTILLGARAAVSLFRLTDEPDAGDLIAQREVPVLSDDYSQDLIDRTNEVFKEVVAELAPKIIATALPATPQDHAKATYYEKRTPEDGLIDWFRSTDQVYRLIRAAGRPYPGAFTFAEGAKLTIWRATPADPDSVPAKNDQPEQGTVIEVDADRGVLIATGDAALWVTELQRDEASTPDAHFAIGTVWGRVRG